MRTFFPTRQVVSRETVRHRELSLPQILGGDGEDGADPVAGPSVLARFVVGLDPQLRPMTAEETAALGDPFSRHILLKGRNPQTVRAVLDDVAALDQPAFPDRRMFLVAEGGQARLSSDTFEFNGRIVVVWRGAGADAKPDMMLSTVPAADDPQALLQLAAWSEADRSFHFFERERSGGRWVWAGNSFHALKAPSRGKGPFDSHINGSLVMKELKEPWNHWDSVAATIAPEAIPPASELRTNPIFADLRSAHELEPIVKTAIRRWTLSRMDAGTQSGRLTDLRDHLRQVLWCTSINLVSSTRVFGQPVDGAYPLPTTFFYDFDAFDFLSERIDDQAQVLPAGQLRVDAAMYERAVGDLGIAVTDDSAASVVVRGDTHFAFLVPERAFEDLTVLRELVEREVVSARTMLCLLMVDFPNPVFSPRRGALLAHAPASAVAGQGGADFDARFVSAVRASAAGPDTPEAEFLDLIDSPDPLARCRSDLAAYDAAVRQRLGTEAGVRDVLELAQSRRRTLADNRSLSEFRSTMAFGDNPKEHLAMASDASVFVKTTSLGEGEN